MHDDDRREAWVAIPASAASATGGPYDFGFVPAMSRLLQAHATVGARFLALYGEVMFSPQSALTRAEREMVAGVAAAAQDCFY